jgi:hypothetical protein
VEIEEIIPVSFRLKPLKTIGGHQHPENNAGIDIPESVIVVRYRTKKMPDCITLFRCRTGSGIVNVFQSGTGLTGCRTVRHSGILASSLEEHF